VTTESSPSPFDYATLVRDLSKKACEHRQPINGTFELTERCNLFCRMCYVSQPSSDSHLRSQELSTRQWLDIARQAVDSGMVFLLLTGGEIFVRPDFFDIYTPLTQMGLMITLFTNGTLITENIAKRLAEAPPSRTEITLYGATAETYEAITGVPGSYARCCAGIEKLLKHRIPLGLKTTLTKHNVGELESMRQMSHNWGVPFTAGWLISKRRDGVQSDAEASRISVDDCIELEATDRATAIDWNEVSLRKSTYENQDNFYCQAGQSSFIVSSQGEMNVCIDLPLPRARILDVGFASAWEQVRNFIETSPPLDPLCLDCQVRVYCHRCPAWSYRETGNLSSPVPYLCEIAYARESQYG
jgi:radical SAM protein with 4Fe4S-binding SPASM domain